jgi:Xaa-Pro aminopeptidase
MRLFRLTAICVMCAWAALAAESIQLSEYKARRDALHKAIGQAVVVLFGTKEADGGDIRTGFFQESNFYYLTGWRQPGAVLVMTPATDILLLPKKDTDRERWTGSKAAPSDTDIAAVTGFETVVPAESFEARLPQWIEAASKIYTLTKEPSADALRKLLPLRDIGDAGPFIARQRMVKSAAELAAIQKATDATLHSHRAAWRITKPGIGEYQIAGTIMGSYFASGCERNAYAPIIGSGPNATVLHYSQNTRAVDRGELVLMDAAAECGMYASDITRTIPASGKFTPRQREIYDVVLGAQNAVIAALKPGATFRGPAGLTEIAKQYIDSHGKDLHGNTLGKYFTHGVSHHVGLDVHDAFDPAVPLAENMVITVEPGIYIPEEAIGVRIEDVVLITAKGAKILSSALPREAGEIEKALAVSR